MKYPDDYINKIICGDCINIMKGIPNDSIDLIVTSPPYGNLRDYGKNWCVCFTQMAYEFWRLLKDGGVVVWVVGDETIDGSETGKSFEQALFFKDIGYKIHDTMIYQKNTYPFPPSNRYYQQFEYMFIFSKGKPKTTNIQKCRTKWQQKEKHSSTTRNRDGTTSHLKYETGKDYRKMDNIWLFDCGYMRGTKDKEAFQHPATFPDKLAERHIISWSNKDDIILDPMCGSGTTCKMAKLNERKFIGIEISEKYCQIAERRLAQDYLF